MIEYAKEGVLHLVTMNEGQNAICPEWQQRMLDVLDRIEADNVDGSALLLTGEGKFFCNGLNLEALGKLDPRDMPAFGARQLEIHRRLIMLPCPSVAALNGHAFAAGAFLAMSCDFRVMREDRGWFCVSEVDVGVPISEPMMHILRDKLPAATARDAVLTGKRYTGEEARAAGIVDATASESELLNSARELAMPLAAKEPGIFRTLKQGLFAPLGEALAASG